MTDDARQLRLETDDTRANIAAYAERARSAFFGPGPAARRMTNREVASTLIAAFPEPTFIWADEIAKLDPNRLQKIVEQIPPEFISSTAKTFVQRLLIYNQQMIRETALA